MTAPNKDQDQDQDQAAQATQVALNANAHKYVRKNLGQRLASLYRNNRKTHQAVDFNQPFVLDAFRRQGGRLGKQALGIKATTATAIAQGLLGKEMLNEWGEALYQSLAQGAERWARFSLANDPRFAKLSTLSAVERYNFIQEMNDKNRVLVSLGGVFGFMGLKGVVLDTAWLLVVSLKAVYELSLIHQKPLSGKDGTRLAYGILAGCELDELGQKQVTMTALALGDGVLKNAQNANVLDELKKFASTYHYDGRHLDELAKYVDLDRLKSKWSHRFLSVGSAVVAVHYNNKLLENVLGVAMATFSDDVLSKNTSGQSHYKNKQMLHKF